MQYDEEMENVIKRLKEDENDIFSEKKYRKQKLQDERVRKYKKIKENFLVAFNNFLNSDAEL